MGVWKKTLVYLGLVEEDELAEVSDEYEEPPLDEPPAIRTIRREELPQMHAVPSAIPPTGQIHTVEPRSFDEAQEIGDKLRASVPVIMNLQGVEDDLHKRLIAFASGAAYVVHGSMQRLAPRIYLITPSNVEVSQTDMDRLKSKVRSGIFDEF
jgi:cell division inhibitor SepF